MLGAAEGVLRVRVAAPAVGGAANDALVRLLARQLRIASSEVQIVSGHRARNKIVTVGMDGERVRSRWPGIVARDVERS